MKEVVLSVRVESFSAQLFYNTIYSDAIAFRRFHKEQSKDPDAQVSSWQDGSRTVSFKMALNVPQVIKKVIGEQK